MIRSPGRRIWAIALVMVLTVVAAGAILAARSGSPASSNDGLSGEERALLEMDMTSGDDSNDKPGPSPFGPDHPVVQELLDIGPEPLPTQPKIPAGAGLISENTNPRYGSVFENVWRQTTGDAVVTVYAGEYYRSDPPHGIIIVEVKSPDNDFAGGGSYFTPINGGAVRITGATDDVLELEADDGTKYLFDVGSRQYLSPATLDVLPAADPPPLREILSAPGPETLSSDGGTQESSSTLSISLVAIDTNVNQTPPNTATLIGSIQLCNTLTVGGTLDVDVIIAAIPPADGSGGGLDGFQFSLVYDEAVVKVTASDANMLLAANSGSSIVPLGDAVPDTDGSFLIAVGDFGTAVTEDGLGVLARITLEGVAPGVSALTLADLQVVDSIGNTYTVNTVFDSDVAVDAACP